MVSYTQSAIGHIPFRLTINMILTCVLTMPCPINWLKERLISSVHLLLDSAWMPTQRWESIVLVAEVRWRRLALRCLVHVTHRASWQIVLDSWQKASSRIAQTECTHSPELLVHRADQWASMNVCDKKRAGCGAIMNYFHSAAAIVHKEGKAKTRGWRKSITTISQRAARIVEGASTQEDDGIACPKCDRELHVFNNARGPIMRCRGWSLAGTPCTLVKACQDGAVVPGGLEYQPYRKGGSSASGSDGPGTLPRRDDGVQDPLPINDWTAQVQALAAERKNNSPSGNFFINNISTLNINSSSCRRRRRTLGELPEGDQWSMDTGTDRIGV